ncbi:Uncharacterised protein [Vibrio cholerae]|nr:Uncharacterised protein [Vibrio cholerae]
MTNTVLFYTTVVLQNQQRFRFTMPQRVEYGCCTTTNTTLRAAFHRGLEVFVERDTASVERFTTTDFRTQRTNAACVDTNTSTLRNVANNRACRCIDRIKAVTTFNQYTRAELTSRSTYTRHNRCR